MTHTDDPVSRLLSRGAELGLRSLGWAGGEVGAIAAERLTRHIPLSWLPASRQVARRNGIVYALDLRDNTERTLFYTGFYDRALHRFLLSEVRRGDTYVDVGAHIGLYALPVARRLRRVGAGAVVASPSSPSHSAPRSSGGRSGRRSGEVRPFDD